MAISPKDGPGSPPFPCGGEGQDPCPPINAVIQALADLVDANEGDRVTEAQLKEALAAAHVILDPFRKS